ncbi:dihydropteroate synthase [Halorubrum gandharaense]
MHYQEAASFLFDLRRFAVSPGTESVRALLDHLGNPETELAFVQVAGSNGKGSTARMVESTLRGAGLSVGLYTSPHLESLSERIRVDGREIPDDAVADFVAEVEPWLVDRAAAGEPLTFFEVVTAMAIHDFARRDADVAVLEVGMGGEYDATSAVDPVATAITNVSLEHTSVLGDTIGEIARTKARIAGEDVPLVTACDGEALRVVGEVAADAGAPLTSVAGPGVERDDEETNGGVDTVPDPALTATYEGRVSPTDAAVRFEGDVDGTFRIPLVGAHQATNAAIAAMLARKTTDVLGVDLSESALADSLARATWPGRFEVMETDPLVVLDGAHNPAACETLSGTLAEYDYDDCHLVYAAMHDKDHAGTVDALPDAASVTTCRPGLDRAEDPAVLAHVAREAGVPTVETVQDVADALDAARERADADDCVLLVGSLFAVAEARATYTRTVTPRRVRNAEEAATALERGGIRIGDAENRDAPDRDLPAAVDHRTVTLRLRIEQANRLETECRALGGACAVGGAPDGGELVPVTLAATRATFRDLVARLRALAAAGLAGVANDLVAQLEGPSDETAPHDDAHYPWEDGTAVMGVLNVTPDSFHDGGRHEAFADAVAGAERMVAAGAEIIDVGGESTRPGADPVPTEAEIDRVVPVVEAVNEVPAVADGEVLVSVDTRKPAVAEAALDAGADVINDVTGLEDPRMREVVAEAGCPVVVMHSVDAPVDPDNDPEYGDVVADVIADLQERLLLAETAGIPRERVVVDPGLGFGKSAAESFALLGRTDELSALGCPVLVGHSHKSLFGAVDRGPDEREHATVAGTTLAVDRGADVVRVHDVAENRAAVAVVEAANDPEGLGSGSGD